MYVYCILDTICECNEFCLHRVPELTLEDPQGLIPDQVKELQEHIDQMAALRVGEVCVCVCVWDEWVENQLVYKLDTSTLFRVHSAVYLVDPIKVHVSCTCVCVCVCL